MKTLLLVLTLLFSITLKAQDSLIHNAKKITHTKISENLMSLTFLNEHGEINKHVILDIKQISYKKKFTRIKFKNSKWKKMYIYSDRISIYYNDNDGYLYNIKSQINNE